MYYLEHMDDVYGPNREINYTTLTTRVNGIENPDVRKFVEELLGSKRKRLLVIP